MFFIDEIDKLLFNIIDLIFNFIKDKEFLEMSYKAILAKWALGEFVGKFGREQKTIIQVLSVGFLFLGELLSGKLGKVVESGKVSDGNREENRGSRVNFPITLDMGEETESGNADFEDIEGKVRGENDPVEPRTELRRGPGRPPKVQQ